MGRTRWLWGLLVLVLVAASCGDDGDGGGGAEEQPQQSTTAPSEEEGEPVSGGELVVLFQSERRALDPVTATPSGASTGLTDFALYGALVGYDAADNEVRPILAESLEPNDTFDVWTLTLKPDLTFTDGSPYDAEAVKLNWERGKDPASRSSSFGILQSVSEMVVLDPLTLEIRLTAPNAVFDAVVSKFNINYIASAEAIRSGHDLASSPIGSGPFMLDTWTRDDRMILVRNPDWYDAPRPYLDRLVVRIVPDEEQRIDTFLTGDGDAMYTAVSTSQSRLEEDDLAFTGVPVAHGTVITMNVTQPPFDDLSMREFMGVAIDYQAMIETGFGADAVAADSFTAEGTPWHSDATALPEYDLERAQELLDAYTAENGPVQISCMSGQAPTQQSFCRFAQSSLNQLDGIEVSVEPVDTPTLIQRSYAHEFDFATWGFPTTYPDPGLYLGVHSTSTANPMGYSNPQVDEMFAEARASADPDERVDIYREIYALLTGELPFRPMQHPTYGYGYRDHVHGIEFYEDAIIRTDHVWVDN
jgi:peptide/nickel transport system substrate-binding protein